MTFLGDSLTAGHGIADVDERFANIFRQSTGGVIAPSTGRELGFCRNSAASDWPRECGCGLRIERLI